jgi:hypothetical protein
MTAAGAALIANRLPGQAVSPVTQPATARFSARLEKGGGPGPSIFQVFDNLNAFDQAIRTYNAILLELVAVDIYQSGGTIYFLGAWNHQALPTRFIVASSFRAFNDTFLAQRSQGYGLIDLNVTTIDGGPFFAGIFQSSSLQQVLLSDITADNLYPEIQGYQKENPDMQLIRIQGYASSPALTSQMLYTVLFQAGSTTSNGFLSEDWSSFYDYFNADSGKNNLLSLSVVPMKGQYKVAAAYLPGDNSVFLLNQPWSTFLTNVDTMTVTQGYHVKSLEVHLIPENWGAAIDAAFGPTSVGYTYGISTGNETSIVARGYAVKDTLRMDQGVPLTLASVSKFLDAVALFLALQEAGISVNAPFLPLIRDYLPRGTVPAPRVNHITIRDLLTHSAGLDEAGGPNYDSVLWDFIAEYVSQPLNPQKTDPAGNPGTVVFYSNSAYQTIRGIVWALTRAQTYHDWVRTRVLVPLEMGETSMPSPPSSSPANYYQRDWTTPSSGPIIGDDASWDSTPDDMLKLLARRAHKFSSQGSWRPALHPVPVSIPVR